jgi:hypothetical protein
VNPFLGSSSGPPGDCMTPSRVTLRDCDDLSHHFSPVFAFPNQEDERPAATNVERASNQLKCGKTIY